MKLVSDFYLFLKYLKDPLSLIIFYFTGLAGAYNLIVRFLFPLNLLKILIFIVFLIISLISLRFIFILFRKNYLSARNKKEGEDIEKQINDLRKKTISNNLKFILPDSKNLEKWEDFANSSSRNWAEDSYTTSAALSIRFYKSNVELSPQFSYFSPWKNQELTIFTSSDSKLITEIDEFFDKSPYISFYKKFPDWNWAVEKAYEKLKDSLPDEYTIWIHSHYDIFTFYFSYKQQKVMKEVRFEFDGKTLKSKDGLSVNKKQKNS